MRAIEYAKRYLAPWGATHLKELQRVMATLAFKSNTECPTYKVDSVLNLHLFCILLFDLSVFFGVRKRSGEGLL